MMQAIRFVHAAAAEAALALLGVGAATPALADFDATLTAVSDYDFRGISQTRGDSAVQLEGEVTAPSFYAGLFASPVDFGPQVAGDSEIDLIAGVRHESDSGLEWRAGVTHYVYLGADAEPGDPLDPSDDVAGTADYTELSVGVASERLGLAYWYAPDLYGAGENGSYVEANFELPLPHSFAVTLHAGYSFGDYYDSLEHEGGDDADYYDFAIGLERSLPQLAVAIAYVRTTAEGEFLIGTGAFRNDARVVLTLERGFALGRGGSRR